MLLSSVHLSVVVRSLSKLYVVTGERVRLSMKRTCSLEIKVFSVKPCICSCIWVLPASLTLTEGSHQRWTQQATFTRWFMARFHYSAQPGLRGLWRQRPVCGCVSTWPSTGRRVLIHSFSGLIKSWGSGQRQPGWVCDVNALGCWLVGENRHNRARDNP